MPNYKELFGDEVCKCGKKGTVIISNGSGKIRGYSCNECAGKKETKSK